MGTSQNDIYEKFKDRGTDVN